jgi:hypothetical protein
MTRALRYACFTVYLLAAAAMAWVILRSGLSNFCPFFLVVFLATAIGIGFGKGWAIVTALLASVMSGSLSYILFCITRDDHPPLNIDYFVAAWLGLGALPIAVAWSLREGNEFAAEVCRWCRIAPRPQVRNKWKMYEN